MNFKLSFKYFSHSTHFKPSYILLLGAPGVGKGTYGRLLSRALNLPELSTGEELRQIVKEAINKDEFHLDPQIQNIKNLMDEGKLVMDEYVHNLVNLKLSLDKFKSGGILDGYPRTYAQAKHFEREHKMNLVVKIELREDILIRKLLGRRICQNCGRNYNICTIKEDEYDMEPLLPKLKENHCDDCGDLLYQRQDDTENTIAGRLELYREFTKPLELYYQDKELLVEFEPKRGIKDYPKLLELVRNKL